MLGVGMSRSPLQLLSSAGGARGEPLKVLTAGGLQARCCWRAFRNLRHLAARSMEPPLANIYQPHRGRRKFRSGDRIARPPITALANHQAGGGIDFG